MEKTAEKQITLVRKKKNGQFQIHPVKESMWKKPTWKQKPAVKNLHERGYRELEEGEEIIIGNLKLKGKKKAVQEAAEVK